MRLIDADALQREFETIFYNDCGDFVRTERLIDDAPTVEERPKGEWIREKEEDLKDKYRCSICGRRVDEVDDYLLLDEDNRVSDVYPYCHCGADMRKEDPEDVPSEQ